MLNQRGIIQPLGKNLFRELGWKKSQNSNRSKINPFKIRFKLTTTTKSKLLE